jgi:hypothetical protein
MTPSKTEEPTGKNARYLWYVIAHKGRTTIHMPCWEGEAEAERCVNTLHGHGWTGPSQKAKDGKWYYEPMPIKEQRTVNKQHPHWREFLPAVDMVERQEQLRKQNVK